MEHLDLPELNERNIKDNQDAIKDAKTERRIMMVLIVALAITVSVQHYKQHNTEDCMAKLYTHLTDQKAPTTAELKEIENPEVYKDLFIGCNGE